MKFPADCVDQARQRGSLYSDALSPSRMGRARPRVSNASAPQSTTVYTVLDRVLDRHNFVVPLQGQSWPCTWLTGRDRARARSRLLGIRSGTAY
ncbi:hypothetical protein OH77DRAFT_1172456 [Trametes cingulata]|nr:hypothetical protein OH77DRAFT_1172456 [Trametes cingulata]